MTVPDDIQLDKMHPIISDVVMSEAPPPTVTEDLPVTIATSTTIESTQTRINQSDFPEVKLDAMHPIISEAAVTANVTVTVTTEDKSTDDLMKTTSDELMTALEELNTVIGTSNTSSVGVVADHVSHAVKDKGSSRNSNISDSGSHDKGSRSNSRQSDHDNRGSRSNSRQSDHDNRGSRSSSRQSNTSSHDGRNKKSPPAESARALYNFSAQNVKYDYMLFIIAAYEISNVRSCY